MTAAMAGGTLHAATLRDATPPAEVPSPSYQGKQYVDSRGCVYVRAGLDGAVRWVPRVTRDREHICGAQPTQAGTGGIKTAKTQKPAAQRPAPKPATPAARRPAAAKVATASAVAKPSRPVTRKPVRKPVVPAQKTRGTRTGMVAQGVCAQLSPLSRRYMGNDADVRCGPQRADPVSGDRDLGASARPAAGSGAAMRNIAERGARIVRGTRIVPRHVHQKQQQSADLSGPPKGYAPVWEDDRLNRKRAHQTLTGKRRMEARWTNTVPRELKPAPLASGARVIHAPSARIVPDRAHPRLSTSSPAARAATATRRNRACRRNRHPMTRRNVPTRPSQRGAT